MSDEFFDCCPGLLFKARSDGSLLRCNDGLRRRFDHLLAESAALADLVGEDQAQTLAGLLSAFGEDEASDERSCILRVSEANGRPGWFRCVARRGSDGTIHGQLLVDDSLERRVEHVLLRAIMESLDLVLWAIDQTGVFVFHDGKGLETAGLERGQFLGHNLFDIYPPKAAEPVRPVLEGKAMHFGDEQHGVHWLSWIVPLQLDDNTTYGAGITLNVSERVLSERSLQDQLHTIREQRQAILELSAPVLNVWDKVLAVPLIGALDSKRTDELSSRLLAEVHRSKVAFAILDMTGVEALDTSIANHVSTLLHSLRLLGVEGLVTGISPAVAQTMASIGIDFKSISTHRTLREGLHHCMQGLAARSLKQSSAH